MKPPFQITSAILKKVSAVSRMLGQAETLHLVRPKTELRKQNRIRTVHSTLQIEGNKLSEAQVSALLDNKRVVGSQKEVQEVLNALKVYDKLSNYKPFSEPSFLQAHRDMMLGLVRDAGQYREGGVGIMKGHDLAHMAPPPGRVPDLMKTLFSFIRQSDDEILIRSCVFHYELEFIHPFSDGNGRMGRLWQTLILMDTYPIFEYLPFEKLIKDSQNEYYKALAQSDGVGHATPFIEYMLGILAQSLEEMLAAHPASFSQSDRITMFLEDCPEEFTRKDYLAVYKDISAPTASRDLKLAIEMKLIRKTGTHNQTRYQVVKG